MLENSELLGGKTLGFLNGSFGFFECYYVVLFFLSFLLLYFCNGRSGMGARVNGSQDGVFFIFRKKRPK